MDDSLEAKVIELHLRHQTQDEIASVLRTSKSRVSRSVREFHETGLIPTAFRIGRPSKATGILVGYIKTRTIQDPSISGASLSAEISAQFRGSLSRTAIDVIRPGQRLKYRPIRHDQALTAAHIEDRLAFWSKMLPLRKDFLLIHLSDEAPRTLSKDEPLLHECLTIRLRWKRLSKEWGTRTAAQLKNRWYQALRRQLESHGRNTALLLSILSRSGGTYRCLKSPLPQGEVPEIMKHRLYRSLHPEIDPHLSKKFCRRVM
jgi:transposase